MLLLELPNEILARVLSFHDTPSPFDTSVLQKPRSPWDSDTAHPLDPSPPTPNPLKQLSLTSRFTRSLVLPILFKHVILEPAFLSEFLVFLKSYDLAFRVGSVVAHVAGHYNHLHPVWWARLLNEVPATRLGIVAPPDVFAGLVGVSSFSNDAWTFDMPFQILRLEQSAEAVQSKIDYDNLPNFLVARPWTGMVVNEGSSLMAYTRYEFFLRRPPSLLAALHFNRSVAGDALFASLLSFDFIAIFPFYNHVDEILKCVRKMKRLTRLFVKLCPEPDSTVLHDEIEVTGGHLDVNDPWNECETSWTLVAHTVVFLTMEGALQELRMDDVKVEGVRETLENSLAAKLQDYWTYQAPRSGVWKRKTLGM